MIIYRHMELRNHPLTVRQGILNWPPVWTPANPRDDKLSIRGEIGVLTNVFGQSSKNTCFLLIAHDDAHYLGALLFDDRLFCQQICKLLQGFTGRTIKEIGDSDLSHLL